MMTSSEFVPEPLPRGLTDATTHPHRPRFSWSIFWSYTGPGWLMSMAYLDPGNLEADLQSGAYTRYQLLYVVLLSTMFGGLYQILAARLGACTGRHLAQLCRSEYPPLVSFGLWIMTELAIIGSDIQEVLGSAVAFELLFGLPLWLGCLLTGLDTFTFLALHKAGDSKTRYLEMFFLLLIATMCVCFFADFTMSDPDGIEIIKGVVEPRMDKQNTMQAVAMLGAIIMPHNIFLHSALVQERRIDTRCPTKVKEANYYFGLEAVMALFVSFLINAAVVCAFASSFFSSQCYALSSNPISSLYGRDIQTSCIPAKAALSSGSAIYDAFTGNVCVFGGESVFEGNVTTAIMNTVSKCTPCYVDGRGESFGTELFESGPTAGYCQEIGLAEAGEAIREALGGYAKVVWAIGLLASGQASTMTGTYAGQFVMEGFLDIRIAAWKRVALTRGVALIPAIIVALISQDRQFQSDRFNELLNVLQSVQLPFALLPLFAFTTSKRLMGPHFVNTRWIAALLVVGTALLCGVNYTLVYDILLKNLPEKLSASAWISLVTIAGLYVTLLLYLLLIYPSETVPPHYVVLPSAVSSELPREEKKTRVPEVLRSPYWRMKVSILPPAKDWRALYRMYWKADPTRHLFKPICEWTPQERKKSGSLPSRLSVAKLIAEDVVDFAFQKRIPTPRDASEATLSMYAAYYVDNWMKNAANTNLNALTVDTLARYIRLDKKSRLVKAQHAYMNRYS